MARDHFFPFALLVAALASSACSSNSSSPQDGGAVDATLPTDAAPDVIDAGIDAPSYPDGSFNCDNTDTVCLPGQICVVPCVDAAPSCVDAAPECTGDGGPDCNCFAGPSLCAEVEAGCEYGTTDNQTVGCNCFP
jgi:hypothetical protein